jgi:hypothetical protein
MSSGFLLAAANFSILAWSLKMKRNDLHVQNGDIKEAFSIFWSGWDYKNSRNLPYVLRKRFILPPRIRVQ